MADIILKDQNGDDLNFNGIETVRFMTQDGGTEDFILSDPNVHYVTFMLDDGITELYKRPVADSDNCADVVLRNLIATPIKESSAQYNYTYTGWSATQGGSASSSVLNSVTEDKTVYAAFTSAVRYYTVTWVDDDGTTLKSESLAYGTNPSYTPSKDGYEFDGWSPAIETVTGDIVYSAQWSKLLGFAGYSWTKIAEIAANGEASTRFKIGDSKPLEISGYGTVEVEIVGFNQDTLSDGSGKAAITLGLKNVISKTWKWTTSDVKKTWNNCSLRTSIAELKSSLPADLQAVIKPVKKTYKSNTSSGTATYATCDDYLWAFSAREFNFNAMSYYSEGNPYTWYNSNISTKLKKTLYGSDTVVGYWIRSNTSWNRYWNWINETGNVTSANTSNGRTLNIHFGFCI
jgi:hypothetical protein